MTFDSTLSWRHSDTGAIVRYFSLPARIVKRHLVVSSPMGGKRAAESDDDDLRENLAVVRAVHRQAGDELLCTRGGETKILQLLGAPRGLARRLHRRRAAALRDRPAGPASGRATCRVSQLAFADPRHS